MHERLLRLILNDYESSFYGVRFTLNKKTIHQRCKNILLTEVYENLDDLSSQLINKAFCLRQNLYNLNIVNVFAEDNPRKKFLLEIYIGKHCLPKLKTVPSL